LPPFIVTLGMWQIVLRPTSSIPPTKPSAARTLLPRRPLLQLFRQQVQCRRRHLHLGVIFMMLLFLLLAYVLKADRLGAPCLCRGRRSGSRRTVRRQRHKDADLGLCGRGLICAFAGWAMIGRIGSVSPTSGQLGNIESITAVVIGGISLFGGRGSIMGMFFGALIVGVFTLGLRLLGADAQWTLPAHRRAHHRRRHRRPVDQKGVSLMEPILKGTGSSSAMAGGRARQLRFRSHPARSWPSSATTAPASPR
jgi:fructose transport system permease protein